MLDQDGDYGVDAGEFLDGCMHLKGSAKAIEVAKLKRKTQQSFVQMRAVSPRAWTIVNTWAPLESTGLFFAKVVRCAFAM